MKVPKVFCVFLLFNRLRAFRRALPCGPLLPPSPPASRAPNEEGVQKCDFLDLNGKYTKSSGFYTILGPRGASKWIFLGSREAQGGPMEAHGGPKVGPREPRAPFLAPLGLARGPKTLRVKGRRRPGSILDRFWGPFWGPLGDILGSNF